MKSDDYVKFLTEQFVHYMNQPRDFRKQVKLERKQNKSTIRNELFGLLPDAFSHTFGRLRKSGKPRLLQAFRLQSNPFTKNEKKG